VTFERPFEGHTRERIRHDIVAPYRRPPPFARRRHEGIIGVSS